eukprot:scaffold120360_cov56-Attheya_sp.AAC.2
MPQHIIDVYEGTNHHYLGDMSELDRMNYVDNAFLGCVDDEERTRQRKQTRRACRHCEANRKEKIAQINRILGSLNYFLSPRQCATCLDYRCKHEFKNGRWKRTGWERVCCGCTT